MGNRNVLDAAMGIGDQQEKGAPSRDPQLFYCADPKCTGSWVPASDIAHRHEDDAQPRRKRGATKKSALYRDGGTRWLMQLSKAALADLCTELLRLQRMGSADEPLTPDAAQDAATPVLRWRGDRVPPIRRRHREGARHV